MYRYVALVWNVLDPRAVETARSLRSRLSMPGLPWSLSIDDEGLLIAETQQRSDGLHAYRLPRNRGAIIGKLFRKSNTESCSEPIFGLSESESEKISKTRGQRLIDQYWGQYVSFLNGLIRDSFSVMRDPTGALSCFSTHFRGVDLFFSNVGDVEGIGLPKFSINWNYLAHHLSNAALRIEATGLNEVTEVLAGQRVQIGISGRSSEFCWDPRTITRVDCEENPQQATRRLRQTLYDCVAAWASCYQTIVLELSGGLDSSILLSCLSRSPNRPDIVCLNFFTPDRKGDEREFARLSARAAGCSMVEQVLDPKHADIRAIMQSPKFVKPTTLSLALASPYQATFERVGREWNVDGFFSGTGGDHLLHRRRSNLVAADFAYRHGIDQRILKIAYDTSRLTQNSFWHVLGSSLKYGLLKRTYAPYSQSPDSPPFLNDGVMESLDQSGSLHPWLSDVSGVPPGKIRMLESLLELHRQHWVIEREKNADTIYPLVSQPLIELCLALPNYVLTLGGRERGLARAAFANDIPREVVERQSKGNNSSYFNKLFAENSSFVGDFLLGGELSRQGLLDRDKLELQLGSRDLFRGKELGNLMHCVSAEVWARSWSDVQHRAAA